MGLSPVEAPRRKLFRCRPELDLFASHGIRPDPKACGLQTSAGRTAPEPCRSLLLLWVLALAIVVVRQHSKESAPHRDIHEDWHDLFSK